MNRKERRLAYATALNSAKDNITVVPDFQVWPALEEPPFWTTTSCWCSC